MREIIVLSKVDTVVIRGAEFVQLQVRAFFQLTGVVLTVPNLPPHPTQKIAWPEFNSESYAQTAKISPLVFLFPERLIRIQTRRHKRPYFICEQALLVRTRKPQGVKAGKGDQAT